MLDRLITIQQENQTRDSMGGQTVAFEDLFETWCKMEPMKGTKLLQYQQIREGYPYLITMRKNLDNAVTAKNRIKYVKENETLILDIHSVVEIEERGFWLELVAFRNA
jgi:SPP1 family predicted phage head-tail adaptor